MSYFYSKPNLNPWTRRTLRRSGYGGKGSYGWRDDTLGEWGVTGLNVAFSHAAIVDFRGAIYNPARPDWHLSGKPLIHNRRESRHLVRP
jgi:hypothetical protein